MAGGSVASQAIGAPNLDPLTARRTEFALVGEDREEIALPRINRGTSLVFPPIGEVAMDRVGLAEIEREIDAEARERFPGGAVRQAVLLQYGDDPEIEPGELWVRVLLAADGPEDYERSVQTFQYDHEAAIGEFAGHLAGKLREIRLVEFTCEKVVDRGGHGPRFHLLLGERLADARAWELGERTPGGHAHYAGPLRAGNRRHADHGGHRGHSRGGDRLGAGPHP